MIARVGLAHRADARPRQLSQGEGQRAAIARALIGRPQLVVADEPTSALDDANAARMIDLMFEVAGATGATLLVATHDGRIASRFAHRLDLQAPGAA
jgi:putative ABC transport system ATP-binding protein